MQKSIKSQKIIGGLETIGIEYLAYLPCGTANTILDHFGKKNITMIPLAREEEGIGMLAGLEASGRKAVLFIQDSGIGNSLNAFVTLGTVYRMPMLIIATRRGGFREVNETNAAFGELVPGLITASRTEYFILDYKVPLDQWTDVIIQSYQYSRFMCKPVIVLVNLKD